MQVWFLNHLQLISAENQTQPEVQRLYFVQLKFVLYIKNDQKIYTTSHKIKHLNWQMYKYAHISFEF